eukprot:TRINITY_DN383_c0_g2_i4.p1 TRINITY_DN383_c0_g2~~TRINITY_DN383_c0_g2_i4.p1  ORF type:complete len:789 (-),score=275.91 TRINITY_DN383_c0_g2_i4:41-2407(-)
MVETAPAAGTASGAPPAPPPPPPPPPGTATEGEATKEGEVAATAPAELLLPVPEGGEAVVSAMPVTPGEALLPGVLEEGEDIFNEKPAAEKGKELDIDPDELFKSNAETPAGGEDEDYDSIFGPEPVIEKKPKKTKKEEAEKPAAVAPSLMLPTVEGEDDAAGLFASPPAPASGDSSLLPPVEAEDDAEAKPAEEGEEAADQKPEAPLSFAEKLNKTLAGQIMPGGNLDPVTRKKREERLRMQEEILKADHDVEEDDNSPLFASEEPVAPAAVKKEAVTAKKSTATSKKPATVEDDIDGLFSGSGAGGDVFDEDDVDALLGDTPKPKQQQQPVVSASTTPQKQAAAVKARDDLDSLLDDIEGDDLGFGAEPEKPKPKPKPKPTVTEKGTEKSQEKVPSYAAVAAKKPEPSPEAKPKPPAEDILPAEEDASGDLFADIFAPAAVASLKKPQPQKLVATEKKKPKPKLEPVAEKKPAANMTDLLEGILDEPAAAEKPVAERKPAEKPTTGKKAVVKGTKKPVATGVKKATAGTTTKKATGAAKPKGKTPATKPSAKKLAVKKSAEGLALPPVAEDDEKDEAESARSSIDAIKSNIKIDPQAHSAEARTGDKKPASVAPLAAALEDVQPERLQCVTKTRPKVAGRHAPSRKRGSPVFAAAAEPALSSTDSAGTSGDLLGMFDSPLAVAPAKKPQPKSQVKPTPKPEAVKPASKPKPKPKPKSAVKSTEDPLGTLLGTAVDEPAPKLKEPTATTLVGQALPGARGSVSLASDELFGPLTTKVTEADPLGLFS